jgi:phosphoglycolate phosphatase-like HAD superfamily hydrolase
LKERAGRIFSTVRLADARRVRTALAIACGDDARHGKPDPALYHLALAKLGFAETCRAIAIGDSPYDAIAAKALGLQATGVLTGGFARQDLASAGCTLVLAGLADLALHFGAGAHRLSDRRHADIMPGRSRLQ